MAGLTAEGFEAKTYEDIRAEVDADQKATIDANLLNDDDVEYLGQLNGIMSRKFAELWELGRTIATAHDPRTLEGFLLTALARITGTKREPATYTRVNATVNLNAGVTLPAGSIANVNGYDDRRFRSEEDVTNSNIIADDVPAVFVALTPGPVEALATTLIIITAPVTGWNSVTNSTDGEKGEAEENDVALRVRREAELATQGSATVDGIRADISEVDGVIDAGVAENPTDFTTSDGFTSYAPHSVSAFLWDGDPAEADDDDFARALFLSKAAGIETNGDTNVIVTDQQGGEHTMRFKRVDDVEIFIQLEATYDPLVFDIDNGEAAIIEAILTEARARQARARDVIAVHYTGAVAAIPGLEELTYYRQDTSAPGAGGDLTTKIVISPVQIAKLDSSRIVVVLVEATTL